MKVMGSVLSKEHVLPVSGFPPGALVSKYSPKTNTLGLLFYKWTFYSKEICCLLLLLLFCYWMLQKNPGRVGSGHFVSLNNLLSCFWTVGLNLDQYSEDSDPLVSLTESKERV